MYMVGWFKNMEKTALICGVNGQDGAYLAKLLNEKNYKVVGTSRDHGASRLHNIKYLNLEKQISIQSMDPKDYHSVLTTIKKFKPNEIYYLAGQSSVGLSFEQPIETLESISLGVLNILEACRMMSYPIKFYNASSSECYGDTNGDAATELTPFDPRSPYAISKVAAHSFVKSYRDGYGIFACNGICFNHESILRPKRFVTQKIISSVRRISQG